MADYEKRVQRLEDVAGVPQPIRPLVCRLRKFESGTAELFSPAERLATEAERDADPERFKAEVEAFCAAASLKAARNYEAHQIAE